jgi:hypothetical protein
MRTSIKESALDNAVLANRACPCEAHGAEVWRLMVEHSNRFMATQTIEFQRRTHAGGVQS